MAANEWLKDLFTVCLRHARTSVLHEELQFIFGRDAGRDVDRCLSGVLDRVLQQIRQHALHLPNIETSGRQAGCNVSTHLAIADQTAHSMHGAVNDDRGVRHAHAALDLLDPVWLCRFNQGFDQVSHAVGLEVDLRQEILTCCRIPMDVSASQGADEPLDVAQRQTQIVCNGRGRLLRSGRWNGQCR